MGGEIVKTNASECVTLGEYRREVLQQPQTEIARRAKCAQGWISQVELGHLPAPWRRDVLLKAYELTDAPEQFERLVLAAAKSKELKKPLSETHPLLAATSSSKPKFIDDLGDLTESEERFVKSIAAQAIAMRRSRAVS